MSKDHRSLRDQIADTERAIWAGNERIQALVSQAGASARQGLRQHAKGIALGAIAVFAVGYVIYPRRHRLNQRINAFIESPLGTLLFKQLPVLAAMIPVLRSLRDQAPNVKTLGGMAGAMSTAWPWVNRFIRHAAASRHVAAR